MKISLRKDWLPISIILLGIVLICIAPRVGPLLDKRAPTIQPDTVYINNPDAVMDAFVYGWRAGRSAVIRAVNSTGGVVNPDTVHKQIEAAFPQDTALFHLKQKN